MAHPDVRVIRVSVYSSSASMRSLLARSLGAHPDIRVERSDELERAGPDAPGANHLLVLDIDPRRDAARVPRIAAACGQACLVFVAGLGPDQHRELLRLGFPHVYRRPDLGQLSNPDRIDPIYRLLRAIAGHLRRGEQPPASQEPRGSRSPARAGTVPTPTAVPRTVGSTASTPPAASSPARPSPPAAGTIDHNATSARRILVIGASTGGPQAIRRVLQDIDHAPDWAIAIVQHIGEGFAEGFAGWLNDTTPHTVTIAHDGEPVAAGSARVAPAGWHLRIRQGRYQLDDGEKRLFQRPSVDNLFESAAAAFGANCLAVLLTGMGRDGGEGCRAVVAAGGATVVQDEQSSVVYGMPRAAVELGAASVQLPVDDIGREVMRRMRSVGQSGRASAGT